MKIWEWISPSHIRKVEIHEEGEDYYHIYSFTWENGRWEVGYHDYVSHTLPSAKDVAQWRFIVPENAVWVEKEGEE